MIKLTVTNIGESMAIVLPNEILARMQIDQGDELYLVETEKGFTISNYPSEIEKEIETARKVMKQYHDALKELAR
ncbi:addiction module antidote [Cyanobacterium stanieri PCC 7202]|uniref:Addiction module antidote n=1 Tax=Cyanobacterium stanieri (strain ATCC 29140 / PCC 7202) TaxID=292563 RepID=K9YLN4_CYASC|nr:addiction module antidote [Cyanobacterium stanieri PCC 7202]